MELTQDGLGIYYETKFGWESEYFVTGTQQVDSVALSNGYTYYFAVANDKAGVGSITGDTCGTDNFLDTVNG